MPEIPLKYVQHTGWREYLRVYWYTENVTDHYHDSTTFLKDYIQQEQPQPSKEATKEEYEKYKDLWPKKCDICNEIAPAFGTLVKYPYHDHPTSVVYQLFHKQLYNNPPRELQPGDIWDAPWMAEGHNDSWAVMLPNKVYWYTYQVATGCNHSDLINKNDKGEIIRTQIHKCWTTTGTPPNIDVNPSILSDKGSKNEWHGHIRNGKLIW
jgi:hypothetical protein